MRLGVFVLSLICSYGLCATKVVPFSGIVVITDLSANPQKSVSFSGTEANKIIFALGDLAWEGTAGAKCHIPAYRVHAESHRRMLLDATVSFTCNNVRFADPDRLKGFASDCEAAKRLKNDLHKCLCEAEDVTNR
jgi:hypothetical protein